jgi:hypothetical protein
LGSVNLKLPFGKFNAYFFDGTTVDSMPLHYTAWKKALAESRCSFDKGVFYAWGGTPTDLSIRAADAAGMASVKVPPR